MMKILIVLLAIMCTSCGCVSRVVPPQPSDMATEWFGVSGVERIYLNLTANGTGTSVFMYACDDNTGEVSTATRWELVDRKISILCIYPGSTNRITGDASYSDIDAKIQWMWNKRVWSRGYDVQLGRVDDVLREIETARAAAKGR